MIASLLIVSCTGCFKEEKTCTPATPASEERQILAYATANGINAIKHNSGLYYEILNPGTGRTPTNSTRVFITYTGKLLNGTQFDQGTNPANTGWMLGSLIEGWKIGLPLIKAGGKIRLIIPSSQAYGCNGAGASIPPNSILFFDIDLVDVQ
jgi:FKBP-type peptidyl-prolyl cis-trans isomerase